MASLLLFSRRGWPPSPPHHRPAHRRAAPEVISSTGCEMNASRGQDRRPDAAQRRRLAHFLLPSAVLLALSLSLPFPPIGAAVGMNAEDKKDAVLRELHKIAFNADEDEIERQLRELAAYTPPGDTGTAEDRSVRAEEMRGDYRRFTADRSSSSFAGRPSPRRKKRRGRQPPPPCMDLNPHCWAWASTGECSASEDYMGVNCPMSCNKCNPVMTAEFSGVKQRTDFTGWPITDAKLAAEEAAAHAPFDARQQGQQQGSQQFNQGGQQQGSGQQQQKGQQQQPAVHQRQTVTRTPRYLDRRIHHVIANMDVYLESVGLKSSASGSKKKPLVVPELCRNRHPHCALWASRGYCDLKRRAMREACPAVCHVCQKLSPDDLDKTGDRLSSNATAASSVPWSTPFERMDLVGIFEAMEEDRVVVPPRAEGGGLPRGVLTPRNDGGPLDPKVQVAQQGQKSFLETQKVASPDGGPNTAAMGGGKESKEQIYVLPLGQIKTFVYRLKPNADAVSTLQKARRWAERGIQPSLSKDDLRSEKTKQIRKAIDAYKDQLGAVKGMMTMTEAEINKISQSIDEREVANGGTLPAELGKTPTALQENMSRFRSLQFQVQDLNDNLQAAEETLKEVEEAVGATTSGDDSGSESGAGADSGENYADGPYVVQFDKFLAPEECQALLSLIKQGKKAPVNTATIGGLGDPQPNPPNVLIGEDGFAQPTTDAVLGPDGKVRMVRTSSRTFFNPPQKPPQQGQQKQQAQSGQRRHHPIVERLLSKIEMVTSIPASAHAELPLQYEKFGPGHFQEPRSHFGDATSMSAHSWSAAAASAEKGGADAGSASPGSTTLPKKFNMPSPFAMNAEGEEGVKALARELERFAREEVSKTSVGSSINVNTGMASDTRPRAMKNARAFGIMVFLSDVDDGGEVVFPNMGNFTVSPLTGRAVLYPTVLSLVGERGDEGDLGILDDLLLDADYASGDGTYLVEDMGTVFMHKPVKDGIKYVLNVYLRRYPYD